MTSLEKEEEIAAELVEVQLIPRKPMSSEVAEQLYKENAGMVHMSASQAALCICAGPEQQQLKCLLKDDGQSPVYDMGPERGGPVRAWIRVASEPPGAFDREVPLRMMPYKVPKESKMCFDLKSCHAADSENAVIEEHNRYITSLLSLFVHANGCTTSCNHITLPPPPDNMAETRAKRLKAILDDKYSATMLAVRYLHEHGKTCEVDYRVEDAVPVADQLALDLYVSDKQEKGAFRFRLPGSVYAKWDGVPEHRDSLGRRVKFSKGKTHCFIAPDVVVELAGDELIAASDRP